MICPNCGFQNPAKVRFCGQCARPFGRPYPHRGFENPAGFRFCGGCGTRRAENRIEAKSCFRRALDIARRQKAKSWELRATTSLGRLLQQRGKDNEARRMLADIYGWFTEGFDTADLKDAKALLRELS